VKPDKSKSEGQFHKLTASEFKEAFDQYFDAIRNYIYFKTSDPDMADDLAQDTFVKLWETRAKIDTNTIKSYLYTIANNLAINQLKRNQLFYKFARTPIASTESKSPEYLIMMKEYEKKLNEVIASMPDGSREVFLMNRIEDLKYREIAERLGISVKAVEKRMSKALQIIRDTLDVNV
jgi:RNA polymerase sigma-70 factor (ECF subfamily)